MVALLFLGVIVIIAGVYLVKTNKGNAKDSRERLGGKIASVAGIIIIIFSIISSSLTSVPAGNRGVVIRFSAVTGNVLDEGL